jgi:HSP20 family protein
MCKVNSSLYVQHASTLGPKTAGGRAHWVPNTDVVETDGRLVIKVELAGMKPEDLEVITEGDRLLICGQRVDGCRGGNCKFYVMEINYGPFECVFEVPAGYDLSKAKAAYTNGFLRIDVPKAVPTSRKGAGVIPIAAAR